MPKRNHRQDKHRETPPTPKAQYGSCARKRPYRSRAFAEAVAVKRFQRTRLLLTVYHCDHCRQFHLTRFPPQTK